MPLYDLPPPARQIYVHTFLDRSRARVLHQAIQTAAAAIAPATLRSEIAQYAPAAGLRALQGTTVRDELVFATPSILRHTPSALGYYRLLLGISQKRFYTSATGLSAFKAMEERNTLRNTVAPLIGGLCTALNLSLGTLLESLPASSLAMDIDQLPLLTLGAQADGSWRNLIGREATAGVFDALKEVVRQQKVQFSETAHSITARNSSGRDVTLQLAADPDVVIKEVVNGATIVKAAIEIKGGTDQSNVHNRAGEAEKSHRKAHRDGAQDFWTVISLAGANMAVLRGESPTTRQWFDVEEVLAQSGTTWDKLVNHTISAMGI
ncbi:MAG: XcyI family restriction endonuclease [Micropruina sp.]|uniref:XcyI family restriction endonuclease n=1 Tax=Micropruina sp. TaxID=2737536 RepID=UPI0039E2E4C4